MKEYVGRILEIADSRGAECDIFAEDTAGVEIEVHRGSVESVERFRDRGIGLRVVSGDRCGYAFTSDLSDEALRKSFDEAAASAEASSPADSAILAEKRPLETEPTLTARRDADISGIIERVIAMEEEAFRFGEEVVNTRNAGYSESQTRVTVGSSRGFIREEDRGYCSCFISAIAERAGEVRSGACWRQSKDPEGIDFSSAGRVAAERAAGLLGARKIAGGRLPVLFDSFSFIDMLSFLEGVLSADMVSKGMSCLAGKISGKVARSHVTVVDDPALKGGCGNSAFDDEGFPTRRLELISGGVLNEYFHTAATADRLGRGRSGNAVRSSFKSIPEPGATNLYLEPGDSSPDDITGGIGEGVLIQNIMGIHTADSISGDFSLGFNGYSVREGKRSGPLCEMTVAGNLLDLLSGIEEVCNDLTFVGEIGSPSVLVTGLSVSGE